MPQPIQLHYFPTPNGHKVTIALEEMGLPYELVLVNILTGDQFKPEFLAISPNNRIPALVDPEGPDNAPISVFESGAMLQYLGAKTGRFYGSGPRNKVEVEEWLYWQMAGLGPMSGQANHFRNHVPTVRPDQRQAAYGAIRYSDEVHRLYGVLNTRLAGRDYVAGDYSIADMASYPWVERSSLMGVHTADFPNLDAWIKRVAERPAVQRAYAAGQAFREAHVQQRPASGGPNPLFGQRAR